MRPLEEPLRRAARGGRLRRRPPQRRRGLTGESGRQQGTLPARHGAAAAPEEGGGLGFSAYIDYSGFGMGKRFQVGVANHPHPAALHINSPPHILPPTATQMLKMRGDQIGQLLGL